MSARNNHRGVFITGPAGNGKTTLMKLLVELMNPPRSDRKIVSHIDMSKVLFTWGVNQNGDIGELSRAARQHMINGGYAPDDTVITVFNGWYEEVKGIINHDSLLLIGGAPRTSKQIEIAGLFENSAIVHIRASRDTSHAAIIKRLSESDRLDDRGGDKIVENRWREYQEKTLPAIKSLNGQCIHLCRESTGLRERLETLVTQLAKRGLADQRLTTHALNKLGTLSDPIHRKIAEIEDKSVARKELAVA